MYGLKAWQEPGPNSHTQARACPVQAAVDDSRNRCEAAVKEGLLWYDRQQATEGPQAKRAKRLT